MISYPKKSRNLFLYSEDITYQDIANLSKEIVSINENDRYLENISKFEGLLYIPQPINIYIDSYGGCMYPTFGLIGLIGSSVTPINTVVAGCAFSAGFLISLASNNIRQSYKTSTFMFHFVLNDIRLKNLTKYLVLSKTKIQEKELDFYIKKKKDWFFTSQEALKYGIIHKII